MKKLLVFILLFATIGVAQLPPVPQPPRVYIDTTWNSPVGGTVWRAHNSTDFGNALASANPGDTIILDAGVTYVGNFTLPAKANPGGVWTYIQSSALDRLPAPGSRVSPSDSANMPRIVTPNASAPLTIAPNANHWRLVGLEVTTMSNQGCVPSHTPPINCFTYDLIYPPVTEGGHTGDLADSITVDRCYVHGSPTQDVREGVDANGTNFAVIDSYISDIHQGFSDSQAIEAWYTPGPIKIVNNFLSASTEDVMFGGAGGYNNPYIPSDIEIRKNHFFKPLDWDKCGAGGTLATGQLQPNGVPCPSGLGYQWVVKNNLEFKSAQRVIVSGNVMENNWISAQVGRSVLFTIRTYQSGNIAVVNDIELVSNTLKNVDGGFATLEQDTYCGAQWGAPNCTNPGESKRIWIHNNLILLSSNKDTYQHSWVFIDGGNTGPRNGLTDYVFQHNTALMMDGSEMWNYIFQLTSPATCPPAQASATHNIWILDNVVGRQPIGDCGYVGSAGLAYYMGDPAPVANRYRGNVMFVPGDDRTQSWPEHNYASTVPFSYVNRGAGNYQLATPYWMDTSDGTLAGIDYAALQLAGSAAGIGIVGSLPSGNQGSQYSATLTAQGGTPPYNWSVVSGTLPSGVSLAASTGSISGVPSNAGVFNFTVRVSDSLFNNGQQAFSIAIACPVLSVATNTLPIAAQGGHYSTTLQASGGCGTYIWAVVPAIGLPAGLTLDPATGTISGTVIGASKTFNVSVSDSESPMQRASKTLGIVVYRASIGK